MMPTDALLFIDANKYLDLYRTVTGRLLLASLREQSDHIFITRQIVDEVKRNKVSETAKFLKANFGQLKLEKRPPPDHLFGATEEQTRTIRDQMRKIDSQIGSVNKRMNELAKAIMQKVAQSTDEVSAALEPIFSRAVAHSPEELRRATERRDRGNPPGKQGSVVGDQLSWEQILSNFSRKTRIWIISKDGDYGTTYDSERFLNQFLYEELREVSRDCEAFLFDELSTGIKHFVETTGAKSDNLPTLKEIEKIKEEEDALATEPWRRIVNERELNRWLATIDAAEFTPLQMKIINELRQSRAGAIARELADWDDTEL
jgi:hypothetical protein